jgi:exodeoxyribonuclease V alpha subunit
MENITGIVADVTFRNEDTGFAVVRIQSDTVPLPIICVGNMPSLEKGESVVVQGTWQTHPRFGRQLSVERYQVTRPTTPRALIALLSSGLFSSIGQSRAEKIVGRFGLATLDILDKSPEKLREIPGIGARTVEKIRDGWNHQRSIREIMLFLQQFGVSVNLAAKIHTAYGDKARDVISQNPYALINDIWGVGFKKADAVARHLGYEQESYRRIKAGLLFCLQEALGDGHLYLPRQELVEKATQVLAVSKELCVFSLDQCIQAKDIIEESDAIYLPLSFTVENAAAAMLRQRIARESVPDAACSKNQVEKWLASYCIRTGWQGDPKQVQAVVESLDNQIFVLTGGPGTGKTTTLQVIVSFLREQNRVVALAAPTGRAAQRMGTLAGLAAQTIHRLLEFRPGKGGYFFTRNGKNPLDADVVILDEVSMVDIFLFRALLAALRPRTRIIFVGDSNQLPSVGPGNVLADCIASGKIPHVNLTTIFRQAAKSTIVRAAHQIIAGRIPSFENGRGDNCFFINEDDPDRCLATIVDLVASRLPKKYGFDPIADLQVLSPMHKGTLGTLNINTVLQNALNPARAALTRGERKFCAGDKVMQVRNNYDSDVFNGDIGCIAEIIDEASLVVDFGGTRVAYDARNLDELVHAYCISIHKSQGCEFKAIVIPLMTQHYIMLQRNLIYTALTRAREICVFVGMPQALTIAVNNDNALRRYSRLGDRLLAEQRTPASPGDSEWRY